MTQAITTRFDVDTVNMLTRLAKRTGRTKSYYIKEAVSELLSDIESLEDKDDYETAVSAWNEYEKNGFKSYSPAEVFKKAGL